MKKYISKILCFLISSVLLAACALPTPGGSGGSQAGGGVGDLKTDGSGKEEYNGEKEQTGGENPSQKTENAGSTGMSGAENHTEDSADKNATGTNKPSENPYFAAGDYLEQGIRNPEGAKERGETHSGTFLNAQGKMELVTFSPWEDTGEEMLFCYVLDENGTDWERQPILWTEGLKGKMQQKRIWVLLGEDGNYYAYYCDEEQLYHMVKNVGDSYEEIFIADWADKETHNGYYAIIGEVAVLANGNIVMLDPGGNLCIYSPDGQEILESFVCGWCETICVSGNEIFVLDKENKSVLHYDGENLKMQPSITGNFDRTVRLSVWGNTLYVCGAEGIFTAKVEPFSQHLEFRKWLDSGKFHFSKEKGYITDFYFLGESFYIVYAEEWGRIKRYIPRSGNENFDRTLTIYSLENSELVIDMIGEFQTEYPNIEVIYETGEGGEGSTLISDHIRALNTRILAGDGPDILILDGLPAQSYVKKEILADLSPVLSEQLDYLQENIVSNYRQDGQLFMLPMRFSIPMIATSGQNVEIFGSLAALVEYCESREGNEVVAPGIPYPYIVELLYYNFPPEIVAEDGRVNEENITTFIRLVKRFCEAEQAVGSVELANEWFLFQRKITDGYLFGNSMSDYSYGSGNQEVAFLNMTSIYRLGTYPRQVEMHGGALLGNKGMFFPNGVIGINARANERELAEFFLQTVFSYEMQSIHSSGAGFSLHKEVLAEDAQVDESYMMQSTDGGKGAVFYFNKKDAKRMIQIAKVVQVPVECNQPIFEIINEVTCACLRGEKSEQEAAEEIVERVQLYYLE